MGSYCTIYFDDLEIGTAKSAVPDVFSAIFQESDRLIRTSRSDGDDRTDIVYETTKEVVLSRLSLMGCTSRIARQRLSRWINNEQNNWKNYSSHPGGTWATDTADAIRHLTIEEWYARVARLRSIRHTEADAIDIIDRHMRDIDDSWLWFDGRDSLVSLRALLDASPHVTTVTLDISDLIIGGWLETDEGVCNRHQHDDSLRSVPLTPTVILAEGHSDINILRSSLSALFPERQDYFSFFEHAELNVDGGVAYLVKFLKAFAAARVPLRIVAVFDNDTAGCQAQRQARDLGLPDNIILIRLPNIDIARTYPTIGPQGFHTIDVNGRAASIELYLGRVALTVNGELCRVRWTGYNKFARAYQGEVEHKDAIRRNFLHDLDSFCLPTEAQHEYPELVAVWNTIFSEVALCAEVAQRNTARCSWRDT